MNNAYPEQYGQVVSTYKELTEKSPFIEYWDFNYPPYSTDYSLFFDPIHLNPKGQQGLTTLLIEQLKRQDK